MARRGIDVTLVEREVISWGATGRNGGFLTGGAAIGYGAAIDAFGRDAARAVWTLAAEGRDLAEQVIVDEGIECDFRTLGILSLTLSDDALESTRQSMDLMCGDGFAGEGLDRQEVQALISTPLGPEISGGTFAPDGALLNSGRYLAGLAAAARHLQHALADQLGNGLGIRDPVGVDVDPESMCQVTGPLTRQGQEG